MIVARTVIQAQFGKGGETAAGFAKHLPQMMAEVGEKRKWRVLTDLSGSFDTVVLEVVSDSLADWEKMRPLLFQSAAFREFMGSLQAVAISGRNNFYTVEGEG